ncbi:hypothetical protein B0H14DRAFT_1127309 [Mycena olivaceomarginata]|nr:hypothetical protein B0H14DRAFT_1127309 [Mycena olivaceomarginata]
MPESAISKGRRCVVAARICLDPRVLILPSSLTASAPHSGPPTLSGSGSHSSVLGTPALSTLYMADAQNRIPGGAFYALSKCPYRLWPSSFLRLLPSYSCSLLLRCPRLVPDSLVPPVPSLSCSHFGCADFDHAGARTSALASCQSGGGPTRGPCVAERDVALHMPESGLLVWRSRDHLPLISLLLLFLLVVYNAVMSSQ